MPNIAAVLKEEIRRLAKKEVKAQVGATKKAVVQYRRDIAKLKRLLGQQEREIRLLKQAAGPTTSRREPLEAVRFSARSVKAQRSRLGLSAADYGKLVGVSGLTIYNWEHGKARPRKAQLAALVAVRGNRQAGGAREVGGVDAEEGTGEKAVVKHSTNTGGNGNGEEAAGATVDMGTVQDAQAQSPRRPEEGSPNEGQ